MVVTASTGTGTGTGAWLISRARYKYRCVHLFFLFPAAALLGQILLFYQQQHQQQHQQQQQGTFPVLVSKPAGSTEPATQTTAYITDPLLLSLPKNQTDAIKIDNNNENNNNDDDDSSSPLSMKFIHQVAANISRVWPHKPLSSWCLQHPRQQQQQQHENENETQHETETQVLTQGLLLVKVPKSASSTVTGVVLRIRDLHHCEQTEWKHRPGHNYADRLRQSSFLVAPIRQPASRALSNLFFHDVSFHGKHQRRRKRPQQQPSGSAAASSALPSDRHIQKGLLRAEPNFILKYTSLQQQTSSWNDNTNTSTTTDYTDEYFSILQEQVANTVAGYDFLFVVERLQESLVVMALLTGLALTDLLTMSSKQAGMFYYTGRKCIALVKPVQSVAVTALFQSVQWKRAHWGDALLHAAAVASLDRTIQALGVETVKKAVADFAKLQQTVELACNNNETQYPCSATGEPQLEQAAISCYFRDFGCGHPCIDRVLRDLPNA
jgi:hypothetical protein